MQVRHSIIILYYVLNIISLLEFVYALLFNVICFSVITKQ